MRRRAVVLIGLAVSMCAGPGAHAAGDKPQPNAPSPKDGRREAATAEGYVAARKGRATLVAPGQYVIDGFNAVCGIRPTVLDPALNDFSASVPGYRIVNPERIAPLTRAQKLYVVEQACGYQFRGPDPQVADCFAVQRGKRFRWLDAKGMDEICAFISKAEASPAIGTLPGPERCANMRKCFLATEPQ